eukprot:1557927-Rhodomonas_salina.1
MNHEDKRLRLRATKTTPRRRGVLVRVPAPRRGDGETGRGGEHVCGRPQRGPPARPRSRPQVPSLSLPHELTK